MKRIWMLALTVSLSSLVPLSAQEAGDFLREMQFQAVESKQANWAHWGDRPGQYSSWTNHSNRLIPVYSFGIKLDTISGSNSCYRDEAKIKQLYGHLPEGTLNPEAVYFDQTEIYELNRAAVKAGKKNIILMVFDGLDWDTTRAAALYRNQADLYQSGRGQGLAFQDYPKGDPQFGFCVTSPQNGDTKFDVDAQAVIVPGTESRGGYSADYGGSTPWSPPADPGYLLGKRRSLMHVFTDSASSASSLNAGLKTYNGSINVTPDGKPMTTLAHQMQADGYAVGVVTSVPISHATPAAVYSHNVTRDDYQDLTRDLIGLPSAYHRDQALPGVDVLIGGGWGELKDDERKGQGNNYVPGNRYLSNQDLTAIDVEHGGKYTVALRTPGKSGSEVLAEGVQRATEGRHRFLGFFGTKGGHLPFQTADGKFDPTRGISQADRYEEADVVENPTLAEMTTAALTLLEQNDKGFYLMIEAGDVDWANHNNNIDDSVGAVFSGEAAFTAVTNWVERNSNWDETCLIVTADHGHMLVIDQPEALTGKVTPVSREEFDKTRNTASKTDGIKKD